MSIWVKRLSSSTNVVDCTKPVRLYLESVGHRGSQIGGTPVFVAYRKPLPGERGPHRQIGIGSTEEAAIQSANAVQSQPLETTEQSAKT